MFTRQDLAALAAELETRLASFIDENRLPGGAAGVVCGDELAWSAGAGFADLATGKPTDPVMLYGIASITKTFTGTAIMQLRDAGRLDLDDPAVRWLPELQSLANPFGPAEAVTIRRMLSHESGLPADPPGTDWTGPDYQGAPEQTLRQAAEIAVQFPPHARHQYSDLAYQWLGEIITRVSGTPYPRYIREAILDPLGLTAGSWLIRLEWTHGQLVFTLVESPGGQIVLTPTADADLFTSTGGGGLPGGNVTFRRFADGRVASVLLLDSTWVRLDRATA